MEEGKKIILDADVIIHFYRGGLLQLLPEIFPNEFIICDLLLQYEILPGPMNDIIQDLIDKDAITVVELEQHEHNLDILIEYSELTKQFGKGESACMAYCKYSKDVIGSSNLKDIIEYCNRNSITFITTMAFLKQAYETAILTEEECNEFVKVNLTNGSKLPAKSFTAFLKMGSKF